MERVNEMFDDFYYILMAIEASGIRPDFSEERFCTSAPLLNRLYFGFQQYKQS